MTRNSDGNFNKISLAAYSSKPFSGNDKGCLAKLNTMGFTEDGSLQGFCNDGQITRITDLTLATFENQRNLKLLDKNAQVWSAPQTVGEIVFGIPLSHPFGKIFSRSLETVSTAPLFRKM